MRMESCMKMRYTMCVGQNLIMSRTELVGMEIIIDEIEMTTINAMMVMGGKEREMMRINFHSEIKLQDKLI